MKQTILDFFENRQNENKQKKTLTDEIMGAVLRNWQTTKDETISFGFIWIFCMVDY